MRPFRPWGKVFHPVENFFPSGGKSAILPGMINTFVSAVMILFIFGMVIYLTKDM